MDKILITYRGGYGDIYSVLTYFDELKNSNITILVEKDHSFLKKLFKNVTFILNPIEKVVHENLSFFAESINLHTYYKENVENFNQDLYDDSIIECSFYKPSQFKPYYNFYKKLIDQYDLIITNYLDLTCIDILLNSNKEWWQIRSWNQWRTDLKYVNLLNRKSPYKNIYYYEKDWIKDYLIDESGEYNYRDNNFFYKTVDQNKEFFNLSFKLKNYEKIFFATLGSMSKHNFGIGRNIKYNFTKEIKKLFDDGWVGITTKREYDVILKNISNEKFVYLIDEWYPHEIIFKYISLFLTHGGAGSFSRGIRNNIKMTVFPFQLDQFYFGKIIEDHYDGQMII
jgi:hypothetical protein